MRPKIDWLGIGTTVLMIAALVFMVLTNCTLAQGAEPGGSAATRQAPVPEQCRSVNKTGVQCVWASLETLGKRDGIAAVANMTAEKFGPSNPAEVEMALKAKGVTYAMVYPGQLDRTFAFLETQLGAGRPCAIGVYSGRHCLLCTHFERGKKVMTLGNNAVGGGEREWTWDQFLAVMRPDGWAFCLAGKPTVKTKDCPCDPCKCDPCKCGPGTTVMPAKKDDPKVVMPNVTVERDESAKLIYIYRTDETGTRYILPADASQSLIDACKERLDPAKRPKITFPVQTPKVIEPATVPSRPQFYPGLMNPVPYRPMMQCPGGRCQTR